MQNAMRLLNPASRRPPILLGSAVVAVLLVKLPWAYGVGLCLLLLFLGLAAVDAQR